MNAEPYAAVTAAGRVMDDDDALIERSPQEPEAFAQVYDRHAAQIHRYVTRRLGADVADDVVADTFLPSPPAVVLSGWQVLLAAATTAASKSAALGTYWHVKSVFAATGGRGARTEESWSRRDGAFWVSVEPGLVSYLGKRPLVRAAAFRALASIPDIKSLGVAPGGYRLLISYRSGDGRFVEGTEKIIVDPKTARLSTEAWAGFGDGGLPVGAVTNTGE